MRLSRERMAAIVPVRKCNSAMSRLCAVWRRPTTGQMARFASINGAGRFEERRLSSHSALKRVSGPSHLVAGIARLPLDAAMKGTRSGVRRGRRPPTC
jgi:hypothetical protein